MTMLRAGTETGSLMNHLMSGSARGPVVGEGATLLHWTDRTAATVIRVSPSGKTAWLREDTAIRTDDHGMSDSQAYRYEPNPNGREWRVSLTKRGWRVMGRGSGVLFGVRRAYHDYSF